jgi:hypothetical protein
MSNYYHFLEKPTGLFVEVKPEHLEAKSGKAFNALKFLASATNVQYSANPDLSDKEITLHVHTTALAIKHKYEAKRGLIAKILEFVKHLFCINTEYDQILKLNKQIQEKQYVKVGVVIDPPKEDFVKIAESLLAEGDPIAADRMLDNVSGDDLKRLKQKIYDYEKECEKSVEDILDDPDLLNVLQERNAKEYTLEYTAKKLVEKQQFVQALQVIGLLCFNSDYFMRSIRHAITEAMDKNELDFAFDSLPFINYEKERSELGYTLFMTYFAKPDVDVNRLEQILTYMDRSSESYAKAKQKIVDHKQRNFAALIKKDGTDVDGKCESFADSIANEYPEQAVELYVLLPTYSFNSALLNKITKLCSLTREFIIRDYFSTKVSQAIASRNLAETARELRAVYEKECPESPAAKEAVEDLNRLVLIEIFSLELKEGIPLIYQYFDDCLKRNDLIAAINFLSYLYHKPNFRDSFVEFRDYITNLKWNVAESQAYLLHFLRYKPSIDPIETYLEGFVDKNSPLYFAAVKYIAVHYLTQNNADAASSVIIELPRRKETEEYALEMYRLMSNMRVHSRYMKWGQTDNAFTIYLKDSKYHQEALKVKPQYLTSTTLRELEEEIYVSVKIEGANRQAADLEKEYPDLAKSIRDKVEVFDMLSTLDIDKEKAFEKATILAKKLPEYASKLNAKIAVIDVLAHFGKETSIVAAENLAQHLEAEFPKYAQQLRSKIQEHQK